MYRYLHLDVFTDTRFEGNQLAVFPEPQGLTAGQMQRIAREMAFSESTFILPAEGPGDVRMRIFTPGEELPVAGHPTIGSTFALAAEGTIAWGRAEFVFELGVGPTPVSLEWGDHDLAFAWMTQPLPTFGTEIEDRPALASALGVAAADLVPDLPVQKVSCGVPFLVVPVRTREAVDAVAVDRRTLMSVLERAGSAELPVFLFTTAGGRSAPDVDVGPADERHAHAPGALVYSRMFAPGFGVVEDPATGGASGPLGSYLVRHRVVTPESATRILSLQGVAMGRPSRIHISIDSRDGEITRVRVGGTAVMVGSGEIDV